MFLVLAFFCIVASVDARCGLSPSPKIRVCNDMEMFEQCKRAQAQFDAYNNDRGYALVSVGCENNIVCVHDTYYYGGYGTNLYYWCQNMDAYNLCLRLQQILSNATKYPVQCSYQVNQGSPLTVDYYRVPAMAAAPACVSLLFLLLTLLL